MLPDVPLDGERITACLLELAAELPAGTRHEVVLAGGALMALHHLRDATQDVDSVRALDAELRRAARVVAARHGLPDTWLNDTARAFLPETFDIATCEVLLEAGTLRVLGLPVQDLFAMKVHAARARDVSDLTALWSVRPFPTVAAAAAHYRRAYPHDPHDPFLEGFLGQLPGAPD